MNRRENGEYEKVRVNSKNDGYENQVEAKYIKKDKGRLRKIARNGER